MTLPKSIKIGPHTFTTRVSDAAIMAMADARGDGISAFTDLSQLTMTFATASNLPVSVIHEVLHALFDNCGLNVRLGSDREEDVIQSIDHGLLAVLRSNPTLVEYLTKG